MLDWLTRADDVHPLEQQRAPLWPAARIDPIRHPLERRVGLELREDPCRVETADLHLPHSANVLPDERGLVMR